MPSKDAYTSKDSYAQDDTYVSRENNPLARSMAKEQESAKRQADRIKRTLRKGHQDKKVPDKEDEIVQERTVGRRRSDSLDHAVVNQMHAEIRSLRHILEGQVSGVDWLQMNDKSPAKASVLRRLSRLGLSADLMRDVVNRVSDNLSSTEMWRETVTVLGERIGQADFATVRGRRNLRFRWPDRCRKDNHDWQTSCAVCYGVMEPAGYYCSPLTFTVSQVLST